MHSDLSLHDQHAHCPKCNAALQYEGQLGYFHYDCMSFTRADGTFEQADACTIAQLRRQLEEVEKESTMKITKHNCRSRIDNAIQTIIDCWEDWQDYARDEAEESDDTEAYDKALAAQINAVLTGMLFDEE